MKVLIIVAVAIGLIFPVRHSNAVTVGVVDAVTAGGIGAGWYLGAAGVGLTPGLIMGTVMYIEGSKAVNADRIGTMLMSIFVAGVGLYISGIVAAAGLSIALDSKAEFPVVNFEPNREELKQLKMNDECIESLLDEAPLVQAIIQDYLIELHNHKDMKIEESISSWNDRVLILSEKTIRALDQLAILKAGPI